MMTVDELLTAIDELRQASDEWKDLEVQYQGTARGSEYRSLAANKMAAAADKLFFGEWSETSLETVTTLADEIRRLQSRIEKLETFPDPVVLLEHAQMKARIEAAATIAERDRDSARWNGSSIVKAEATAWNAARAEFRKALELE